MKKYLSVFVFTAVVISGCGQGNERLQEKASIEGRANSQAAIEAENANLAAKAQAMESDLDRRHRFYEAVEGTYMGTLESESGETYAIELSLNSSLPRYPSANRARTLEELSYEVNNLYVIAQVKEWPKEDANASQPFGCIFEQVRPDLVKGKIFLASESCKKTYTFYLTNETSQTAGEYSRNKEAKIKVSRDIAKRMLEGVMPKDFGLFGAKKTNLSAKTFNMILRKELPELAAQ